MQVHEDMETGDKRNKLLYKYVLFLGALAPEIFLFENVPQFQTEVKTPEGTFHAAEVLAEAIQNLSHEHIHFDIASKILACANHLIPQKRERFLLVGIRSNLLNDSPTKKLPDWCLSLTKQPEVPVLAALEDLPAPFEGNEPLSKTVKVAPLPHSALTNDPSISYKRWIRQCPPFGKDNKLDEVDSHSSRKPREDDRKFFALLGPGKRWMDYRCDKSNTLAKLETTLSLLRDITKHARTLEGIEHPSLEILKQVDLEELESLLNAMDGSLSLRLLLENIEPLPGEPCHHLAGRKYLSKRDGNHGDWLSRLGVEQPSKTIVSHMAKDTYAFVHPYLDRTLSAREAARIQTFPDWFSFRSLKLTDAFRVIGNAVPPLLSNQLAEKVARVLWAHEIECNRSDAALEVSIPAKK